jgi:phosphoribosylaminoimidazolecarboxamide formyltransferase/IMP cyclohydrolase
MKVFNKISQYDAMIFDYLNHQTQSPTLFSDELIIKLSKKNELRYGENPHQKAAIYDLKIH